MGAAVAKSDELQNSGPEMQKSGQIRESARRAESVNMAVSTKMEQGAWLQAVCWY
jgi:hypothetical protein